MANYLFTSESVSEGHPDKVADQISDALIDNFLAFDAQSKVAQFSPFAGFCASIFWLVLPLTQEPSIYN